MKTIRNLAFLAMLVSGSTIASEFNDRSGFYVGLGGGFTPMYDQEVYIDGQLDSVYSEFAIHSSFKLGGFINRNFALYYMNDVQWYSDDAANSIAHGLTGIGASFYLGQTKAHQLLVGIGASTQLLRETGDSFSGVGFTLGYGNVINERLSADIKFTGYVDDTLNGIEFINLEVETYALSFALNYNWF